MSLESCPICKINSNIRISADLYKCSLCNLIFNINFKSLSYNRDYFITEYESQYGKTYIDDFENIYGSSKVRLKKILKLIENKNDLSILDIGSAAGFFLKAAKDYGIKKLKGIEISHFASEYCKTNFFIDIIVSSFEDIETDEKFDIITSWFFIEHLPEPLDGLKKIYNMLNKGGVFAMSVPSFFGPMFCFSKNQWIASHPKDHTIDLSPCSAKKILKTIGFKKIKIKICGYHPERVVRRDSIFFRPFEALYRLFSYITKFSDTIEIYAVK
ncbi:MAG: class I SAM-dependent methyltransferase [Spirochaetes bacterium]|nr:class I SAM-dependent methyltransferase [Spirochaetota bacterium]